MMHQAWCDLTEAVDLGRIWSASRIACEHRLAIDRLWAPEDDGLQPDDVRQRRTGLRYERRTAPVACCNISFTFRQFVSGHRYTSPTGSTRVRWMS